MRCSSWRPPRATPRSAGFTPWTCRRAAGATRPASPGFWTAKSRWPRSCRTSATWPAAISRSPMAPPQWPWGRSLASGMERLVHHLRGIRIGVALGGGAARGMSHLGVLKALEQNGIVVDMIAGTSAGAMTGIVYASGLDCDYTADRFSTDLRPGWIFRHIPHGNHWYLVYKYRRGPIRSDAPQVPPRLEARTTRRPLPFRHRRSGGGRLRRPRAGRRHPRDPRKHQSAGALRPDLPRWPGADRRRDREQHPRGRAGVEGMQLRDRRQRDGQDGEGVLRHHSRQTGLTKEADHGADASPQSAGPEPQPERTSESVRRTW